MKYLINKSHPITYTFSYSNHTKNCYLKIHHHMMQLLWPYHGQHPLPAHDQLFYQQWNLLGCCGVDTAILNTCKYTLYKQKHTNAYKYLQICINTYKHTQICTNTYKFTMPSVLHDGVLFGVLYYVHGVLCVIICASVKSMIKLKQCNVHACYHVNIQACFM